MSLRFDRIDNFLFVLRHELEHVRRRDGLEKPVIDVDVGRDDPDDELEEQERTANVAAREFCVPKKDMDAFIARKSPYFLENDLIGFAKALRVHPGIVAGQLQFRTQKFTLFRSHLVSVRNFVLPPPRLMGGATFIQSRLEEPSCGQQKATSEDHRPVQDKNGRN